MTVTFKKQVQGDELPLTEALEHRGVAGSNVLVKSIHRPSSKDGSTFTCYIVNLLQILLYTLACVMAGVILAVGAVKVLGYFSDAAAGSLATLNIATLTTVAAGTDDETSGQAHTPVQEETFKGVLGPGGLPPAYLSIKGWQNCLGSHHRHLGDSVATHSEHCLPRKQPTDCEDEAFQRLVESFSGMSCPERDIVDDTASSGASGAATKPATAATEREAGGRGSDGGATCDCPAGSCTGQSSCYCKNTGDCVAVDEFVNEPQIQPIPRFATQDGNNMEMKPAFKWDNPDKPEALHITLPDGSKGQVPLKLSPFTSSPGACIYLSDMFIANGVAKMGNSRQQQPSAVAITGCPGSDNIEITMAGSGSWLWMDKTLTVSRVPSPFENGATDIVIHQPN